MATQKKDLVETARNLLAQGCSNNECISILMQVHKSTQKDAQSITVQAIEELEEEEKQKEKLAKASIARRYDYVYHHALESLGDEKLTAQLLSVMLKATDGLARHYGTQSPEQIEVVGINAGSARRDTVEELIAKAKGKKSEK